MAKRNKGGRLVFEKLAQQATKRAGSPLAFTIALGVVLVWVMTGPLFAFSDTWQLVINTGTTIVTFLIATDKRKGSRRERHPAPSQRSNSTLTSCAVFITRAAELYPLPRPSR